MTPASSYCSLPPVPVSPTTMKRVEPSFKGSVSVTGAGAATRVPSAVCAACAAVCAYTCGERAAAKNAAAVNNEARKRLMSFPFMNRGLGLTPPVLSINFTRPARALRERVGHEVDDEPVLPVYEQKVSADVSVPHLLRQLRQLEQERGRHL